MPRAHRHRIPGQVWHITGRCHRREFLLEFARDRRRWVSWLYEARKRYGLSVLNYQATSNHVHLVARDRGEGEIERALQLIEGCAFGTCGMRFRDVWPSARLERCAFELPCTG